MLPDGPWTRLWIDGGGRGGGAWGCWGRRPASRARLLCPGKARPPSHQQLVADVKHCPRLAALGFTRRRPGRGARKQRKVDHLTVREKVVRVPEKFSRRPDRMQSSPTSRRRADGKICSGRRPTRTQPPAACPGGVELARVPRAAAGRALVSTARVRVNLLPKRTMYISPPADRLGRGRALLAR